MVISVIGQELLSASCFASSVIVLESALRIGSCSLKLRGQICSSKSLETLYECLQKDFIIVVTLKNKLELVTEGQFEEGHSW